MAHLDGYACGGGVAVAGGVAVGGVPQAALGWAPLSPPACQALAKPLAAMATAGTPAFSTATMSWASHDVQPPQ